jgi:arginyl-tRNA synthetase
MTFENELQTLIGDHFSRIFEGKEYPGSLTFQPTRKEFEGDITLVVFPLTKVLGMSPDKIGNQLGEFLRSETELVSDYNVVKGFLNIVLSSTEWLKKLNAAIHSDSRTFQSESGKRFLVEYSSPNTNKPLHLGHIRNNLLGYSVSRLLESTGAEVLKVNIVNDRGIHICKSMLAWQRSGENETPESSGLKGDHLVGKYYVLFDKMFREEIKGLMSKGYSREESEKHSELMMDAQEMLRKWEKGDSEVIELWKKMNGWVYEGFDITYKRLGVDFDKIYYESETYLLGKKLVEDGLEKGLFFKKPDGSVWVDLSAEGLDNKLLLRADGTAVYITQDLGTAVMRYDDFEFDKLIYVVGNEQDYHFKVLFLILKKLGYEWADNLYHLSYNMVDLPEGKMKSREGTVVDADDLMDQMEAQAEKITRELGKIHDFASDEARDLYRILGMGALKYFILKVDPEKRMLFNPKESIDFNGNTGPFIQYTHARIRSVLRKAHSMDEYRNSESTSVDVSVTMNNKERELVKLLVQFPQLLTEAAEKYSPAIVANYVYELTKAFNQFYHDHSIIDEADRQRSLFRLNLSREVGDTIRWSTSLLGIEVPEKM